MEVYAYSNASNHLPHYKAMEVQESGAAADIPSIKEQIHGMEVEESGAAKQVPATNVFSQVDFLKDLCETGNVVLDFDSWTSLISDAEKTHADDMERMSLVFDSFLSKFPLYPEYWKRYADHMMRLSTSEKVVEIFERAVESATHSVGLWGDYCSFGMFAFKDPFSIRRLFERALSFVGKDYLCHTLWDMYLKFEFSQQQWSSLAHIIIRSLKFPTKALHDYFDNLKKFASIMEEEMTCHGSCRLELQSEAIPESKLVASEEDIYHVISELQYSTDISIREKALYKYISIGKQFYHKACQLDEKIHCFESCIQRPSFHVKPLDENQLENWHAYLDFVEKQDDFDWAVKLYERCLIVCANYPEFWMRYVELMESKGGREIATFALDRATQIFLKNVPEMHYYTARFREQVGDSDGARAAFFQCSKESNSYFIEKAIKEANMEKRLGNLAGAFDIYEKALKVAVEGQMLHTIPVLCIHFHRLKYLITGSAEAARDILIDGIQHVPHSKSLLEELIKFVMLHEGLRHLDAVDTIIASAISYGPAVSQGLGAKDREELSCLYLEFVDLCGSNNHLRKAWKRHIKLFPHLIRTPFSHKHPTSSSDQLLNVPIDERQSEPLSFPNHPGKGHDQNNLVHLSEKEKELKVSENQAVMSDQFPEKDGDVYEQESMQQISLQVIQSGESEAGIDKQTSSLLHQSGDSVSRSMESSHDLHREDSSGPVDLSIVMLHQSQEPGRGKSTPDFEQPGGAITPLEASEHNSDCVITEQEPDHDCGAGLHVKEVSVDSLSLNTRTNESQDINPTAIEHTGPHEISLPDTHPSSVSPLHSPVSVSGKTEIELEEIQAGGSSSSGSHQKGIQTQTHSQPVVPTSSGAIVESDEHPQQQQQQQQTNFLLEQLATAHIGDKMEVPNSTLSHNHSDVASTQGGIMPDANVVHQNSGSASKPVYAHAQTHISQYPMQSNEQLEHIQQTQAYNQMLEYYYQQQQYQQQLLQMQQPYSQQHQQPYNQPQFQQYYLQQQQLQQQQLNLSSFQSQQIQQPQYPLYPNQEQYQQYQMLIQQYQLQQEQGYQQLLQQHQLQGYQQPHQHQQLQQQQQIHDGLQEHQEQITSMQNQIWNVSQGQQGQGIGLLPTPGASETLHSQHQSPQIVSAGGLTRHVLSPHKFQHSPYGGSSDSLRSPSIARQSPQG